MILVIWVEIFSRMDRSSQRKVVVAFTLVYNCCWKQKMLCIKVFLKSTFLLLIFVFEMCMSIHCVSYFCCHRYLLEPCFNWYTIFWVLICNFENCANANSRLKITLKDLIKKGVPFARNETQKQKKLWPLDGGGDASMS